MRPVLISVTAIVAAGGLAAQAIAAVNYNASKSNTGAFAAQCRKAGGTLGGANGETSCVLHKPTDSSSPLLAACASDGGRSLTRNGQVTCAGAGAAARSGHNGCKASEVQTGYGCQPRPKN